MAKDHRGREGRHRLKAPCGTALSGSPGSAGQFPAGHARYSMRVRRARLSERGWYRGSMAFRPGVPGEGSIIFCLKIQSIQEENT